jgi:hypothetical protein
MNPSRSLRSLITYATLGRIPFVPYIAFLHVMSLIKFHKRMSCCVLYVTCYSYFMFTVVIPPHIPHVRFAYQIALVIISCCKINIWYAGPKMQQINARRKWKSQEFACTIKWHAMSILLGSLPAVYRRTNMVGVLKLLRVNLPTGAKFDSGVILISIIHFTFISSLLFSLHNYVRCSLNSVIIQQGLDPPFFCWVRIHESWFFWIRN